MSIKPPLKCPPDYSILSLCYFSSGGDANIGITKGPSTESLIKLSSRFCIPVTNWQKKNLILKPNSTVKLDISELADFGLQKESYKFSATLDQISYLTEHKLSFFNSDKTLIDSISFTVEYEELYSDALRNAFNSNATLVNNFTVDVSKVDSTGVFTITSKKDGIKFNYVVEFDIRGTYQKTIHPGNLVTPNEKYPNGACRLIFLAIDYEKSNTGTCGTCRGVDGFIKSNLKYIKWFFDSDVKSKETEVLKTNVLITPKNSWPNNNIFYWNPTGVSPAYTLKNGDMIYTDKNTTGYAIITEIDGYKITVDDYNLGDGFSENQIVYKKMIPGNIKENIMGNQLVLTGGTDVSSTDNLLLETVWLNNPQTFEIPVEVIIAI